MRSNDMNSREELREALQAAIRENDGESFGKAMEQMVSQIETGIREDLEAAQAAADDKILAERGVRQLTSEEKGYYQSVIEAMRSRDPRQAISNVTAPLPTTVVEDVFTALGQNHPLLSLINFRATAANVDIIVSTNGYQRAAWGNLTAAISQELSSGFTKISTGLNKLTAYLPIAKSALELGPEWLDRYVREVLYEALAHGLEYGIVTGTGANMPIGMDRDVSATAAVVAGVYPQKTAYTVNRFDVQTVGNLISIMSKDSNNNARPVEGVALIVNPVDYYKKIMPATTLMAPDGSYRNDVLPYPMTIIPSAAMAQNSAIIGMPGRYFAAAGIATSGRIEYSDEYQFLADERTYVIRTYANGRALDDKDFLLLDITNLEQVKYEMVSVDGHTPSSTATLSTLNVGTLTLSPTFAANTTSYTASTTNASDLVFVQPTDAAASVSIKIGSTEFENGGPVTWSAGENALKVKVIAEDGSTNKTYTVTVTKS